MALFQWYDGDAPTPWFFAFYYIATWVRAHVQLEVSVNILGVTFRKSLYDGETPDILAAECGGWVKWYEARIEGAGACKAL